MHSDMREYFEAEGIDPDTLGVEFVGELGRIDSEVRFIAEQCHQLASAPLQPPRPQPARPYYRQRQRW